MPLARGSSREVFDRNVSEMMHAGYAQNQALAAAYRMKRKGYALGGPPAPWFVRNEARSMTHAGPISSMVAGRTDHHPMHVSSGSYVLPADHVSSMGQGNTVNGMVQLNHMFKMGPYGGGPSMGVKHGAGAPRPPRVRASGGASDKGGGRGDHGVGHPTPIMAAGGEFVIPPEKILDWLEERGLPRDIKFGHAALDDWVVEHRKKHVKTLRKLPGPAKA